MISLGRKKSMVAAVAEEDHSGTYQMRAIDYASHDPPTQHEFFGSIISDALTMSKTNEKILSQYLSIFDAPSFSASDHWDSHRWQGDHTAARRVNRRHAAAARFARRLAAQILRHSHAPVVVSAAAKYARGRTDAVAAAIARVAVAVGLVRGHSARRQ